MLTSSHKPATQKSVSHVINKALLIVVTAFAAMLANADQAVELIYFYDPDCASCRKFDDEVGKIYSNTSEARIAPMRKFSVEGLDAEAIHQRLGEQTRLASDILGTPTFVMIQSGAEVDRISGYGNDELFWMGLQRMINRVSPSSP